MQVIIYLVFIILCCLFSAQKYICTFGVYTLIVYIMFYVEETHIM